MEGIVSDIFKPDWELVSEPVKLISQSNVTQIFKPLT
jgi:hypothetical protein